MAHAMDSKTTLRIGNQFFYLFDIVDSYAECAERAALNAERWGWAIPEYVTSLDAYRAYNAKCGGQEVDLIAHGGIIASDGLTMTQRLEGKGVKVVEADWGDTVEVRGRQYKVQPAPNHNARLV